MKIFKLKKLITASLLTMGLMIIGTGVSFALLFIPAILQHLCAYGSEKAAPVSR